MECMTIKKKRDHDEYKEHFDESWLIPYADLLTLLLALFIVLYAMNSVDKKKYEEMSRAFQIAFNSGIGVLDNSSITSNEMLTSNYRKKNDEKNETENIEEESPIQNLIDSEQEDMEKMMGQIDKYISGKNSKNQLDTKLNQSELLFTINSIALFEPGKVTINPDAKKLANDISSLLQQYPDYEIKVSGHTDNVPVVKSEYHSNWDLSLLRAIRFMELLLENKKLNPKLFSAVGYGEYRPIAPNSTAEGRAKNRRVEVAIKRKYSNGTKQVITLAP